MPDALGVVLERARTHATINFSDASVLLTTSLNRIYAMAHETDSVCGLSVIHVGTKNLRLPARPLLRLIGELDDERTADEP